MRTCLLIVFLILCGCNSHPEDPIVIQGMTMGTNYSITLGIQSEFSTVELQDEIDTLLDSINQKMSTYIDDSELSKINQSNSHEWLEISPELFAVFSSALEISQLTGGAFDITVGNLVNLWGFGPDEMHSIIPDDESIESAMLTSGYHNIELLTQPYAIKKLNSDIYIDLSGIAKGYAVDKVSEYLDEKKISSYLVDIGGEIKAQGEKQDQQPWRIGIEKPLVEAREVQRIVTLVNEAMATSGDYRNFFTKNGIHYSHTIDPRIGHPIRYNLLSVTVLDQSAMVADALATALLVMGPEDSIRFAENNEIPAYLIYSDGNSMAERFTSSFLLNINK
jgi:FAD:protein FMN transferase